MALIVMPDAKLAAVSWLAAGITARSEPYTDGVTVATTITPGQTPQKFIYVREIPGTQASLVHVIARLNFVVFYSTGAVDDEQNRSDLARMADAIVRDMRGRTVDGTVCYLVEDDGGLSTLPDPVNGAVNTISFTRGIAMRGTTV